MGFYGQANKPNAGKAFNASLAFSKLIFYPMVRIYNLDASELTLQTTPSQLLCTNGELEKLGDNRMVECLVTCMGPNIRWSLFVMCV